MSQRLQRVGGRGEGALPGGAADGPELARAPAPAHETAFLEFETPLDSDEVSTRDLIAQVAPRVSLSMERAFKRLLDLLGALTLTAVFSPLILVILVVTHRSGGSAIFRHKRVGRNGEIFECLKFRTMVPNAERVLKDLLANNQDLREEWDRDHKLRDDPRVTPLGKFLRNTSLDELPQIWNVVKGEMSLVGPRPVTREELLRYGRNMLLYMMVKPGITGLWQVSGRSNTDYRRRVAIDVCYVRNQSVLLDLWILLKTTRVVICRHGAY
jgi:Undecaprenyl-phosphate galactose phosphotransferase WbaP